MFRMPMDIYTCTIRHKLFPEVCKLFDCLLGSQRVDMLTPFIVFRHWCWKVLSSLSLLMCSMGILNWHCNQNGDDRLSRKKALWPVIDQPRASIWTKPRGDSGTVLLQQVGHGRSSVHILPASLLFLESTVTPLTNQTPAFCFAGNSNLWKGRWLFVFMFPCVELGTCPGWDSPGGTSPSPSSPKRVRWKCWWTGGSGWFFHSICGLYYFRNTAFDWCTLAKCRTKSAFLRLVTALRVGWDGDKCLPHTVKRNYFDIFNLLWFL